MSRLPTTADVLLIDDIRRDISLRNYSTITQSLERLTGVCDQCSILISLITPVEIVQQLKDSGLNVEFDSFYDLDRIRWQDLPNIAINSPSPIPIRSDSIPSQRLMNYCQLVKIPFIITDENNNHDWISNHDGTILELDLNDVENLSDENKKSLHQISSHYGYSYYQRLLKKCEYDESPELSDPSMLSRICSSVSRTIYRLVVRIPWYQVGDRLFNITRLDISDEELYTDSIFDEYWKKLTPEEIIKKHFNPEHLLRIGVELPDVNLVLTEIGRIDRIDIIRLKRLLPYSDPSHANIVSILEKLDNDNEWISQKAIQDMILLVRYKRNLMYEYIDHPFVRHLIEISVPVNMKNSRTNPDN